jgi:molybdopterin-containing oxidoreductase family iron-sulfur binding subunit
LFDTKQFQDVLMSLNGMSGDYYDYLKASSSSCTGSTWNKIVHDGVMLESTLYINGSADYSAAAGISAI